MKKMIAFVTIFFLMALGSVSGSQEVLHIDRPKIDYKSFGFRKPVKQAGSVYYKSDEKGYEPKMLEVFTFNEDGHLVQKYIRIIGQYGSETAYNYAYANGMLDGITTLASAANFNSEQKLYYSGVGKLEKIAATGKYISYTDAYSYNENGTLALIERRHQSGSMTTVQFDHAQNCVFQKETPSVGAVNESVFIYDGEEPFASFISGTSTVTFYDAHHRIHFKTTVEEDPLAYVLRLRDLRNIDFKAFTQQISALRGQPQSTVVFDIPVEVANMDGDWIKRLQIDRRFETPEKRLVFKKIVYADGTESGDTDFDMIFQGRVSKF